MFCKLAQHFLLSMENSHGKCFLNKVFCNISNKFVFMFLPYNICIGYIGKLKYFKRIILLRIAILIGINNYSNLNKLSACSNDVKIMKLLIEASGKFDEIYAFQDSEANSINLNANLMKIFSTKEPVEEVFFYFSGHGQYSDDEFFYALQDYDAKKKNQTSLTNGSLDSMIKTVNPKSVIKVVDSCNSGVNYIKENGLIEKHFNVSKQNFHDCYFLFSSKLDQYSYADEYFSQFTKCFIDAVLNAKTNVVRYKYIIDYISDCFQEDTKQKPFFITQGDFTQMFGQYDAVVLKQIENEVEKILPKNNIISAGDNQVLEVTVLPSLKELIINDNNKNYCTKEDADKFLQVLHDSIRDYKSDNDLRELYNYVFFKSARCIDSQIRVLSINKIAEILSNSDADIFARVNYKEVGPKNVLMTLVNSFVKVADTYEHTFNSPYFALRLMLCPKDGFNNIKPYDITFVYLLSKNEIYIYYYFSTYYEYSWNQFKPHSNIEWQSFKCKLNNISDIQCKINDILNAFENFVIDELKENFDECLVV